MTTRQRTSGAVLLAILAQAGCIAVRSSTSPDANLSHYRTFAWYTPPSPTERQLAFERSPAAAVLRARIAADLRHKGIGETQQNPDFLVAYRSKLETKLRVDEWGTPNPFWGAAPGPVDIDEYAQGTLLVELIDAKTGKIFWRGTASAAVDPPENPNLQKLGAAVDRLMKKYPGEVARR